jgi:hypothetical protein
VRFMVSQPRLAIGHAQGHEAEEPASRRRRASAESHIGGWSRAPPVNPKRPSAFASSVLAQVEFWAAILGAVVGGLASLAGSVTVGRRETIRAHRIELFRDMVPAANDLLTSSRSSVGVPSPNVVDTMGRTAAVVGRRESKRVAPLLASLDKVYRMRVGDWPWPSQSARVREPLFDAAMAEALRLLEDYSDGLRRRIR